MKSQWLLVALVAAFVSWGLEEAFGHGGNGPPPPRVSRTVGSNGAGTSGPGVQAPGLGAPGTRGPQAGPGTRRGELGRPTTGGRKRDRSSDGEESYSGFVPGQTSQLPWNSTQKLGERFILVYVYNISERKGKNFEFSKALEKKILQDEKVNAYLKRFCCEKVCREHVGLVQARSDRGMIQKYLSQIEEPESMPTHLAILDHEGKAVFRLEATKKTLKVHPRSFLKQMAKATKSRRVEASP